MKKSSKIIVGLSVVAGLLVVSQVSSATPSAPGVEQGWNKVLFTPNLSQPAECQTAPKAFEFLYSREISTDKVTLKLKSNPTYTAMSEEAHIRGDKNVYFTDSILLSGSTNPIHLFGEAERTSDELTLNHTYKVVYWFYAPDNSTPCRGNALITRISAPSQK